VWAKEHHLSKAAEGFAAKLAPRYDGPYHVMGLASPVICGTIHVSELKQKQSRLNRCKTTLKVRGYLQGFPKDNTEKKSKDISKDSQRILRKKSPRTSPRMPKGYHERSPRIPPRISKGNYEKSPRIPPRIP